MNKNLVAKRIFAILLSVCLAATLLAGCGKKSGIDTEKTAKDLIDKMKRNEAPEEEPTEEDDTDEDETVSVKTGESDSESIIREYIDGVRSAAVKDSYIDEGNSLDVNFNNESEINLDDITNKMTYNEYEGTVDENVVIHNVSYGKLDVEQAPGDWYCVDISFNYMDEGHLYHILHVLDGKLFICGAYEGLYRTFANVNKYGVASCGGSGGAGAYIVSYYVPDQDGDYQLLYTENENYPGWDHYEGDKPADAINAVMHQLNEEYAEDYEKIGELCITQTYINDQYYYSASPDDPALKKELEDLAKENGVEIHSQDEINKMIDGLAEKYGVSHDKLRDQSELSSYLSATVPFDASKLSATVYTYAGSDQWAALGKKSSVPFAKASKNANSAACFVTENSGVTVTLEEGEWVQAKDSEYDFFHPTSESFTFRPDKGVPYEFRVYETEGIPASRLKVYYRGFVGLYYFTADGRDPEEGGGVAKIEYEPYDEAAPDKSDPFITLAKVYAGMLVNAGNMYDLNDGVDYWRTLANAVTLLQQDTERAQENGIFIDKWLLSDYADAMGMWELDVRNIQDGAPVTYYEDQEIYLITPSVYYSDDDVELLDITKDESGAYTLSMLVKGQVDRKVEVHVKSVRSVNSPFRWSITTAGFADDAGGV